MTNLIECWDEVVREESIEMTPGFAKDSWLHDLYSNIIGTEDTEDLEYYGSKACFYAILLADLTGYLQVPVADVLGKFAYKPLSILKPYSCGFLSKRVAKEYIDIIDVLINGKDVVRYFEYLKPTLLDCQSALKIFLNSGLGGSRLDISDNAIKGKSCIVDRRLVNKKLPPATFMSKNIGVNYESVLKIKHSPSYSVIPYLEENILNFDNFAVLRTVVSSVVENYVTQNNLLQSMPKSVFCNEHPEHSNLFLDRLSLSPFVELRDMVDYVKLSLGYSYDDGGAVRRWSLLLDRDEYQSGRVSALPKAIGRDMNLLDVVNKNDIINVLKALNYAVRVFSKRHSLIKIEDISVFPFASENSSGLGICIDNYNSNDWRGLLNGTEDINKVRVVVAIQ